MDTKPSRWPGLLAALLLLIAIAWPLHAAQPQAQSPWTTTWTASPQPRWDGDFALPTKLPYHFWNQTLRQVARTSIGGARVRVLFSNAYGTRPLRIGAAHVALAADGASIIEGSDHALTFGGATSVTIPP